MNIKTIRKGLRFSSSALYLRAQDIQEDTWSGTVDDYEPLVSVIVVVARVLAFLGGAAPVSK